MKKQTGLHLVDILISLFLLSMILVSIDSMFIQVMREARSLYYLHFASQQLFQLHEQLLFTNNHVDIKKWNEGNAATLPHGYGNLITSKKKLGINIFWNQKNHGSCQMNEIDIHCLTLTLAAKKELTAQ